MKRHRFTYFLWIRGHNLSHLNNLKPGCIVFPPTSNPEPSTFTHFTNSEVQPLWISPERDLLDSASLSQSLPSLSPARHISVDPFRPLNATTSPSKCIDSPMRIGINYGVLNPAFSYQVTAFFRYFPICNPFLLGHTKRFRQTQIMFAPR